MIFQHSNLVDLDQSIDVSVCLFHSQSKPAQVRGKKGQDGEVQLDEEDASSPEQQANEKQSVDSSQQSDATSHEHVSAHRLI